MKDYNLDPKQRREPMNLAKQRARVVAIEQNYSVHVHGCFGEIEYWSQNTGPYCHACGRTVQPSKVVAPFADKQTYLIEMDEALRAFDDLEEMDP